MPDIHEIDLLEFPHLSGGLFIIDIIYENDRPIRFQYRLAGKEMVETIGTDVNGRFLDEIFPAESYQILMEDYQDAINSCEPRYMSYLETSAPNAMILFERLLLPVGPEGADRPAYFVGLHTRTAKGTARIADSCHPFAVRTD